MTRDDLGLTAALTLLGAVIGLAIRWRVATLNYRHDDEAHRPPPGRRWWIPVAVATGGGVLRIGNARRDWFDPAARSAGLDGLTPHELRHTAASLAVKAGASVLAVQRMLGHDKPSTTLDVYADLFDEDLDRVAERLVSVRSAVLADYLRTEPRLVHRPNAS